MWDPVNTVTKLCLEKVRVSYIIAVHIFLFYSTEDAEISMYAMKAKMQMETQDVLMLKANYCFLDEYIFKEIIWGHKYKQVQTKT